MNPVWEEVGKFGKNLAFVKIRHNPSNSVTLANQFQLSGLSDMVPLHLPLLMGMFPGVAMLNIDKIATLTKYRKGTLYNLNSSDKLPFKVNREMGDKILVSIVEMAAYMDKAMLSETQADSADTPEEVKRKPGRPRGSTKAKSELHAFQAELSAAIARVGADTGFAGEPDLVPVFMDSEGLVSKMPLAEPPMDDIRNFQPPHEVRWVPMEAAFATVWQNEDSRRSLLAKITITKPGLSERVEAQRKALLSSI